MSYLLSLFVSRRVRVPDLSDISIRLVSISARLPLKIRTASGAISAIVVFEEFSSLKYSTASLPFFFVSFENKSELILRSLFWFFSGIASIIALFAFSSLT